MGQILLSTAMSISGLFFAFFRGWWMSLILFFAFPVIMIGAMMIGAAIQSGFSQGLKSYG
jgi:ABC-type multidrug transport system fused ATPase/permease subunit